jgi:septum formation inhibitor MinC
LQKILLIGEDLIHQSVCHLHACELSFFQGFSFDIIVVPSSKEALSGKPREKQFQYLLQHARPSSRGLSLGHTILFKKQEAFVNSLARILKFWVSSLHSPGDPNFKKGCSFRMELIAIEAAKRSNNDMRKGLKNALILIRDFQKIYITRSPFYSKEKIPESLLKQLPLLINPSDPRENLLDDKGRKSFRKLAVFAKETLKTLSQHSESDKAWDSFGPQAIIGKVYHKDNAIQKVLISSKMCPKDIVLCVITHEHHEWQPRVLFPRRPFANERVYTLKWIAQQVVTQLRASGASSKKKKKAARTQQIAQMIIQEHISSGFVSGREDAGVQCFDDRDVVLICPLADGSNIIVKVGFNV